MEERNLEFWNDGQGNVYFKDGMNMHHELKEEDIEIISSILYNIESNYVEAYKSLETIYEKSKPNYNYYRFKMASRFIRCNCGEMDTLKTDIDNTGRVNVEQVRCPLRGTGDCKYENIICMPKRTSVIKGRQLQVAASLADGHSNKEIANLFSISINTVHNIIQQLKAKLRVSNTGQIASWYNANIKY